MESFVRVRRTVQMPESLSTIGEPHPPQVRTIN
jgi:hypothetical protein